jgi:sirohydrochlorin cobaltochelatase
MCKKTKKAILVISSGTTNEKARKENIEAVENRIAENFRDYDIRRAYSSKRILSILKESQDIIVDNPVEAIEKLIEKGYEELIVQPLQIIPGMEYESVLRSLEQHVNCFKKLGIGRPVLYDNEDYEVAVEALKTQLPELGKEQAAVLMGHGSSHTANDCYSRFQDYIDKTGLKAYLGTIKGIPGLSEVIERLKRNSIKEVILMPFMLVAGNHALIDMASEEDYSWKTILKREGFKVRIYLRGLGENIYYQNIYVKRVEQAIRTAKLKDKYES